jgi:hypothetical protein
VLEVVVVVVVVVAGGGFAGGGVEDCACNPAQSMPAVQRRTVLLRIVFVGIRFIISVFCGYRLVRFKHPPCHASIYGFDSRNYMVINII